MLGKPSLQYRFARLLLSLLAWLTKQALHAKGVMNYRFKATREHYLQVSIGSYRYSGPSLFYQALDSAATAVNTIIAFILAMIATIIGVNLIGPVATAVGGALKNGNLTGAANSLTAQITLLFVVVVILGVVIFIAVLGKMAAGQAE